MQQDQTQPVPSPLSSIFGGGQTAGTRPIDAGAKATLDGIFGGSAKTPTATPQADVKSKLDSIFNAGKPFTGDIRADTPEAQAAREAMRFGPKIATNVAGSVEAGRQSIDETNRAYSEGKIGLPQAFLNNIWQPLKLAISIPVDAVKGVAQAVAPDATKKAGEAVGGAIDFASGPLAEILAKPEVATYETAGKLSNQAGNLLMQAHSEVDPEKKQRILLLAKTAREASDAVRANADSISTGYQENAKTADAGVGIASLGLGAGGAADEAAIQAARGAKAAGTAVADAAKAGLEAITPSAETPILNETRVLDTYNRAIRPTVAGKANAGQIAGSNARVVSGLKGIAENKGSLKFTDADGNITAGETPRTVDQLSQAIQQTKSSIFKKYDALAKAAGDQGVTVDAPAIAKELDPVVNSKALSIANPSAIAYAKSLQARLSEGGLIDAETAQEVIRHYNESLKAYYRSPSYETASNAAIDAMVAGKFREALDKGITGATGQEYQALKDQYGALSSMEKDVARRNVVWSRQNAVSLPSALTNVASGAELARGLLTMNPVDIGISGAIKGIQMYQKYLNNPDKGIERIFREINRTTSDRPAAAGPSSGESPSGKGPSGRTTQPGQGQAEVKTSSPQSTTKAGKSKTIAESRAGKPATQGGFISIGGSRITPEIRDSVSKALSEFDNSVQTVNGKPDLSNPDAALRIDELKAKLEKKALTDKELSEAAAIMGFKPSKK